MDDFSHRIDKGPAGAFGADSGDERRFRLREFHERKSRSPGFYARSQPDGVREPVSTAPETSLKREWKAPPVKFGGSRADSFGRLKVVLIVGAALAVVGALAASAGFVIGRERGKISANWEMVQRAKTLKRLPEKEAGLVYEAMRELRAGHAETALDTLRSLRTKFPHSGSLSYLAALAALQAGQFVAAENFASDSIKAGQRLSDSLALMAMLEQQKSAATGGGSGAQAEELLRAAITADAANPAPHLELAALLRHAGRREEARREIRTAQALLNPVDAHTVTEVTLALMELEDKADDQISTPSNPPRNLAENLSSAYAAMRKGNFGDAANFLRSGQAMTSPDIFYYLISDPVFRRYRNRTEIAPFWQ